MSDGGPEVEREEHATGGRYLINVDGHVAEMTYSRAGTGLIIIDHTGVPDELRGRKLGSHLVRRAVQDARDENLKIIPLCPFAATEFRRHPEYRDVLSK